MLEILLLGARPALPTGLNLWLTNVLSEELNLDLTDVYCLGALGDRAEPALFAVGFWEGEQEGGTYMELHAAVTGMDIRKASQWGPAERRPNPRRIRDACVWYGPLDAPVFDTGSPVLQVFRLGYLRVVDSGSGIWKGVSRWRRSWSRIRPAPCAP